MAAQVRCVRCHNRFDAVEMYGRLCEECFNLSAEGHAAKHQSAPMPRATLKRIAYGGIAFAKDDGLDVQDLSGDYISGRRIG